MLLVFGLVISFYFIVVIGDGITQNRLIQAYHNESYDEFGSLLDDISTNITFNTRRRLTSAKKLYNINEWKLTNFNGENKTYLGVALITYSSGRPFCTGSYIGDKYVLTAAHCLFDKKLNWKFKPVQKIRVEFGITNNSPRTKSCKVENYRVNDQFPVDPEIKTTQDQEKYVKHDYAVLKLDETCRVPSNVIKYQIKPWVSGVSHIRAGYRGTRTLTVAKMKSGTAGSGATNKCAAKKGDSGGPLLRNGAIEGVTSAGTATYTVPLQITDDIKKNIKKYIEKKDGISPTFPNCNDVTTAKQCWSECGKLCNDHKRSAAKPLRRILCNSKPKWMKCGKDCPSGKKQVSMTPKLCPGQTTKKCEKTKCPYNGVKKQRCIKSLNRVSKDCNKEEIRCQNGEKRKLCINKQYRYLCGEPKIRIGRRPGGSLAHFRLKNFMEMYYEDMNKENVNDDLYYDDFESVADYDYDDDDDDDDDDADYYDDDDV